MNKVKLLESDSLEDLEKAINTFLENKSHSSHIIGNVKIRIDNYAHDINNKFSARTFYGIVQYYG